MCAKFSTIVLANNDLGGGGGWDPLATLYLVVLNTVKRPFFNRMFPSIFLNTVNLGLYNLLFNYIIGKKGQSPPKKPSPFNTVI